MPPASDDSVVNDAEHRVVATFMSQSECVSRIIVKRSLRAEAADQRKKAAGMREIAAGMRKAARTMRENNARRRRRD